MDNFSASPSEIHTSPDAREVTGERDGGWEGGSGDSEHKSAQTRHESHDFRETFGRYEATLAQTENDILIHCLKKNPRC